MDNNCNGLIDAEEPGCQDLVESPTTASPTPQEGGNPPVDQLAEEGGGTGCGCNTAQGGKIPNSTIPLTTLLFMTPFLMRLGSKRRIDEVLGEALEDQNLGVFIAEMDAVCGSFERDDIDLTPLGDNRYHLSCPEHLTDALNLQLIGRQSIQLGAIIPSRHGDRVTFSISYRPNSPYQGAREMAA